MKLSVLLLAFLNLLSGCFAPPQHFELDSELYKIANPPLTLDSKTLIKNSKEHKVVVAVLDGGIDYNNDRLKNHLHLFSNGNIGYDILGRDFFPSYAVVDPENGKEISEDLDIREHGTHVTSLALLDGFYKNKEGVKERFSKKIGLFPIRVLPFSNAIASSTGNLDADLAYEIINILNESVNLCLKEGIDIINMSLGADLTRVPKEFLKNISLDVNKKLIMPLKNEWKNILFVAAAGNEKRNLSHILMSVPASLTSENLISVGALKNNKIIADFSNFGELVDVYIRGEDIKASVPLNLTKKLSGTSMASPLVANLAAKIKVLNPKLTAIQIKKLIIDSSDDALLPIFKKEGEPSQLVKVKVVNFKKALKLARTIL